MAEPLNLIRELKKQQAKDPNVIIQNVLRDFGDAQRFILPVNARILDNGGKALDDKLRLPFPSIVLEFTSEIDTTYDDSNLATAWERMSFVTCVYDRHIVFAKQLPDGDMEVQLASKFVKDGKFPPVWNVYPFKVIVDPNLDDTGVAASVVPTHEKAMAYAGQVNKANPGAAEATWKDIGLTILKPAFKAVAELLEALACSNVKAELKPNKKRLQGRRPGELPYDDYHELVVYTHRGSGGSSGANEPDPNNPKRREHLRRGHIRTYKTGLKIWVQSHVVNAGVGGKITKQYKVKDGRHDRK